MVFYYAWDFESAKVQKISDIEQTPGIKNFDLKIQGYLWQIIVCSLFYKLSKIIIVAKKTWSR